MLFWQLFSVILVMRSFGMSESRICPVCGKKIPEDVTFECPYCHFDLKWLDNDREIERTKQSLTGKLDEPEKSQIQKRQTTSIFYHLFACILGGCLPWIVAWWIFPYEMFAYLGLRVGLVTGFVFGYFAYRYEKKNRKPDDRPFVFLIRSFIISFLLSSPFLCVLIIFSQLYAS